PQIQPLSLPGSLITQHFPGIRSEKQTDPSAPDFLNFAQNDRSICGVATELGYLAGMGAELVLTSSNRQGRTLVFARAGTNRAFRRKGFNLEGYPYNPQLEPGGFTLNAGFKFFFR
ncbi:MAG TPA: hypothetical protein VHK69_16555, partial [Chitinophagaceae bacterium]|nr:hypothetical protein [Chitinophagaceae bacterium]